MKKTVTLDFESFDYTINEGTQQDLLKVGSIVMLKSGSPYMTVSNIISDETVECYWFNNPKETAKLETNIFKRKSLLTVIPKDTYSLLAEIENKNRPNTTPVINTKKSDSNITVIFCIMYLLIGILIGAIFL